VVVLGIDPGSIVTGYGVVEATRGRLREICHGQIRPRKNAGMSAALAVIYERLRRVASEFRPDAVAVESIFYGKNPHSLIVQGHVRGVAILAGVHCGLPVFEYSPLEVKKAVVGYGQAEKGQVQQMVKAILQLPEVPAPDAADALAVAVCHAHFAKVLPV
jgi:crossover junction endodeoxyribonuclease RuvC